MPLMSIHTTLHDVRWAPIVLRMYKQEGVDGKDE